jgi:quercetin dioxygenase-like cupin family protein
MNRITVTRWPANAGQVTINKIRARLEQEGFYPSRFDMVPGDSYDDHSHPEAEVRWVVSGRLRVKLREGARPRGIEPVLAGSGRAGDTTPGAGGCDYRDEIILEPGDRLELAPNVVHSAEVVGDEVVVTVSASRLK